MFLTRWQTVRRDTPSAARSQCHLGDGREHEDTLVRRLPTSRARRAGLCSRLGRPASAGNRHRHLHGLPNSPPRDVPVTDTAWLQIRAAAITDLDTVVRPTPALTDALPMAMPHLFGRAARRFDPHLRRIDARSYIADISTTMIRMVASLNEHDHESAVAVVTVTFDQRDTVIFSIADVWLPISAELTGDTAAAQLCDNIAFVARRLPRQLNDFAMPASFARGVARVHVPDPRHIEVYLSTRDGSRPAAPPVPIAEAFNMAPFRVPPPLTTIADVADGDDLENLGTREMVRQLLVETGHGMDGDDTANPFGASRLLQWTWPTDGTTTTMR